MSFNHLTLALVGATAIPGFSAPTGPTIQASATIGHGAPLDLAVDTFNLDLALPKANGNDTGSPGPLDEVMTFTTDGNGQAGYETIQDAVNHGRKVALSIAFTYPASHGSQQAGGNTITVTAEILALANQQGSGHYTFQVADVAFDRTGFTPVKGDPDIAFFVWEPGAPGTGSKHLSDHHDIDLFGFTVLDDGDPGSGTAPVNGGLEIKRPWGGDVHLPDLLSTEIKDTNFAFTNYWPLSINVSPANSADYNNTNACWHQILGAVATRVTIHARNQVSAEEKARFAYVQGGLL